MPLYRDQAIVLRTHKLGEADRIITLLTRQNGKVRAVAKGVRRTSSKFGARLEPFMHIDVQLNEGRSLDMVTQVETIGAYARTICQDYSQYTCGTAMLETADRLVAQEGEPMLQQFQLLAGGLRTLSQSQQPPTLILDSYLLRAFSIAGYAPTFTHCAQCGAPGPHRSFSVAQGGSVCTDCRQPGANAPAQSTFDLLAALLVGDWPAAALADQRTQDETSALVTAFSQYHLEHSLRSLKMVDRTN